MPQHHHRNKESNILLETKTRGQQPLPKKSNIKGPDPISTWVGFATKQRPIKLPPGITHPNEVLAPKNKNKLLGKNPFTTKDKPTTSPSPRNPTSKGPTQSLHGWATNKTQKHSEMENPSKSQKEKSHHLEGNSFALLQSFLFTSSQLIVN